MPKDEYDCKAEEAISMNFKGIFGVNPTKVRTQAAKICDEENRSWLKAAGTVLDGPRVENKGPLFRDTREHTSTSTPTRLNDQDQPASNLTSPAAESGGSSTEPSPGLLHDSGPTLDSGPHNGDPSGQSTTQLRRSTRLRRPPDRYVP
ncbi:hypothetical protein HPB52_004617 [Rhipicephalus sanguineus]|uniref:Uncharacterized protein n=1 Tax=Rhipicephalus sanguineus TaxID=34632 RepID=A0A9D4PWV8_RHISA|nr:hypothetical protein HPB52_004617 [Rhipicephalus sanguineus]